MSKKIKIRRVEQTKTSDDKNWKDLKVNLYNIDEMILYYIQNVIVPRVDYKTEVVNVPVMYGTPERWKSAQLDVGLRTDRGVIQTPLIMIKRTGLSRNANIPTTKIDAQNPQVFRTFVKKYTDKNKYDHYNLLHDKTKIKELQQVVIPDYITAEYEVIMWTDYVEHMTHLIELFVYHGGSYWGNEYSRFYSQADSFSENIEMSTGKQRTVKCDFNLSVNGYILPENYLQRVTNKKEYTTGNVSVKFKIS